MNHNITTVEDLIAAALKYSDHAVELLESQFGIELVPARWQDEETDWRAE